jgi:hypothetical protein
MDSFYTYTWTYFVVDTPTWLMPINTNMFNASLSIISS